MDEATRKLVRLRAGGRCEYCLHRQEDAETTHQIEHIVANSTQLASAQGRAAGGGQVTFDRGEEQAHGRPGQKAVMRGSAGARFQQDESIALTLAASGKT